MRFQLVSDLHLDFHRDNGVEFCNTLPVAADTIIIAGDLCNGISVLYNSLEIFAKKFKNVVFVLGNHEHYLVSQVDLYNVMGRVVRNFPNVHWLNASSVNIDGVDIHGASLWFNEDPYYFRYKSRLADFAYIPKFVPWVFEENARHVQFLKDSVKPGDVVVTHHLPSYECVDGEFVGDPLNRFFVCNIENVLRENKPAVAVHGHSHGPYSGQIHDTRIYRNPFGYPSEGGHRFNPSLVIEV